MKCAYRESGWWQRTEMQPVKWTTEGIGNGDSQVFYDVRHTLVVRNMLVFCKVHGYLILYRISVNQGGTADKLFVLDRGILCQGLFCVL